MASYNVAAGLIASHDNQLSASTVDTVTFANAGLSVEIISDGSAKVYVTVDGSTPTVSGGNCYLLPAAMSAVTLRVPVEGAPVVKLISTGTSVYSVSIAS